MNLQDAIAATAELCGSPLSIPALTMIVLDVDQYPEQMIFAALRRCRMEHKGRLTAEAIISRLDDGRPGPEEAWAMIPRDEAGSVVWTDEMAAAFGIAGPLLAQGEPIPARMAFIEHYRAAVTTARLNAVPPRWTPSLGHDPRGREQVLLEASKKGRIGTGHPLLLQYEGKPPALTHERRGDMVRIGDAVPKTGEWEDDE